MRSSVWTFLLISLQRQYRRPESLPQHAWLRALTLLACSLVTGVAWRSHKYRRLRIGRVLCAQPGLRTTQEQLRHSSGTGFGTRTAERPLQSQERHGGGGEGRLVGEGASSGLSGLLTWLRFQQEEINPPPSRRTDALWRLRHVGNWEIRLHGGRGDVRIWNV